MFLRSSTGIYKLTWLSYLNIPKQPSSLKESIISLVQKGILTKNAWGHVLGTMDMLKACNYTLEKQYLQEEHCMYRLSEPRDLHHMFVALYHYINIVLSRNTIPLLLVHG